MKRIRDLTMFLLVFEFVAVVASGCSADPQNIGNADDGGTVSLKICQELDVLLQTIGPGQFGVPTVSSTSVRFLDVSFPAAQNPGGPRQLFRFLGASGGQADISIPFDGDTRTPFTVSVTVN